MTEMSLVLNNFIKNLFTHTKSSEYRSLLHKLQTSNPYSKTGIHFVFSSSIKTSSEAILPILPKILFCSSLTLPVLDKTARVDSMPCTVMCPIKSNQIHWSMRTVWSLTMHNENVQDKKKVISPTYSKERRLRRLQLLTILCVYPKRRL